MKKPKFIILLVVYFFFFGNYYLKSQLKNISVEFGMLPSLVVWNDKITSPLGSSSQNYRGGGFFSFNNAFSFKTVFKPFANYHFSFPIGFEYIFYRAYHRVPISPFVTAYLTHSIDLPSINIGSRYSFFKLPFANVWTYGELNLSGNFVGSSKYSVKIDYQLLDSSSAKAVIGKTSVFRFGGSLRFGFLGEIDGPWNVNIYSGLNLLNLLGRQDSRGELLTPSNIFEPKENPVYNFQLGLSIIYNLK